VPSFSVTAQFSSAATLAAASLSLSRVAGFVSGGQLEAVVISVHDRAAAFGGAGALGAAAEAVGGEFVRTADFSGGGALSAVRTVSFSRTAAFGTAGNFAAAAAAVENYARTAAFTSGGTLSAAASEIEKGAAGFAGAGQLSAAVVPVHVVSAQFGGSGTLAGTASEIEQAAAALAGSGQLAATVTVSFSRAAAFSGGGDLAATASQVTMIDMKANAASNTAVTSTRVIFTNYTADGSYPGTSHSGGKFLIGGAGDVRLRVTGAVGASNLGVKFYVMKNGVELGMLDTQYSSENGEVLDVITSCVNGDQVWVEVVRSWAWDGQVVPGMSFLVDVNPVATLTTTHSDNFNRANQNIDATAPWDDTAALAKPQIVSNQVTGTSGGDPNTRGVYETSPSASRAGQFYKLDIAGIGSRVGVVYNSSTGSDSSWAILTNSTTLLLGFTNSTTSSNAGTTEATVTVPTVTPPKTMLVLFLSDLVAAIFIDGKYVATHTMPSARGVCGGLYTASTTDIVDNYSQGTFVWA
jgi:hypothetical protein